MAAVEDDNSSTGENVVVIGEDEADVVDVNDNEGELMSLSLFWRSISNSSSGFISGSSDCAKARLESLMCCVSLDEFKLDVNDKELEGPPLDSDLSGRASDLSSEVVLGVRDFFFFLTIGSVSWWCPVLSEFFRFEALIRPESSSAESSDSGRSGVSSGPKLGIGG